MQSRQVELLTMAMLDYIRKELDRLYWNKNQKEMVSPFDNTGAEPYSNSYMTIRSYNWNGNDKPNFETENMKVSWYKHSNRGVVVSFKEGLDPLATIAETLQKSVQSLEEDFQDDEQGYS